MEKIKKQRTRAILTLKLGVLVGVVVVVLVAILPFKVFGAYFETFDTYNVGTELRSGAGNWVDWASPYGRVSAVQSLSTPNSGFFSQPSNQKYGKLLINEGFQTSTFAIYIEACPTGNPFEIYVMGEQEWSAVLGLFWSDTLGEQGCSILGRHTQNSAWALIGYVDLNVWNIFVFEQATIEGLDYIRYSTTAGQTFTDWLPCNVSRRDIRIFLIASANLGNQFFLDDISSSLPAEELRVFGVSPASGSTATSTAINFTIGWEGWDFEDIYKDFVFSFWEKNTGIVVGSKIYTPTTTAGTYISPLSDFGFSKNGIYYFHAKARSYLYEYTAYYTGDLVSPEWWVNVNVEGWEAIFEMPEFEGWYAEHSKFTTSTAIFTGIATFLGPIFNKIGEFGNSVVEFLDLNEAYDRGYDLGKIIPTFRHYVSGIEVFFGGFPIIQVFLAFMIILFGIFVVRLILKFKP